MTRLAILTPAAGVYGHAWQDNFARYEAALSRRGFRVEAVDWLQGADSDADAILPLLAWGYHLRVPEWMAMLDAVEARGLTMINPARLLRWNTRKTYLAELEDAEVPVVPTVFLDHPTLPQIEAARDLLGGGEIVVKPQISGGSHETVRFAPGAPYEGGPTGPTMIQPFLPSVAGEGELSLLYFGGVFSHAVGKVAQGGDFRVQPQFGSRIGRAEPSQEALEVGAAVFAALDKAPAYARVDLIRHLDGSLRLMELEVLEPDLFLQYAPEAEERLVEALETALA